MDISLVDKTEHKKKKRQEALSREIVKLTGGVPPMKPSFSKKYLKAIKDKPLLSQSATRWVWATFKNSARSDELEIHHWRRKSDPEEDYAFSRFNIPINLVSLTEAEYDGLSHPPDWTKEETFYLWEMCQRFDLRFIVIQDRYDTVTYPDRSVEDLKERYYGLARQLLEKREISNHPIINMPYNSNYERTRKLLLEKYYMRTREQQEEEKRLLEEAKKLDCKIKKEEKDLKNFEKLMNSNSEEIEIPEWSQGKKEPGRGPYLMSFHLTQPTLSTRTQNKIEKILMEIGISDKPMPTKEIVEQYEKLRKEILVLLYLQKYLIKKENEKKNIDDKLRNLRKMNNRKTHANLPYKGAQLASQTPKNRPGRGDLGPRAADPLPMEPRGKTAMKLPGDHSDSGPSKKPKRTN